MLRIKIGPVRQVQNGLGQVVADIGGIFCPLVPQDILHKESAAGRLCQQFLNRPDPFAFFTASLLSQIDAPSEIRIKGNDLFSVLPLPAFGADPHQRVDDLRRVHDRCDLLLRVDPVQKGQYNGIRGHDFPDILQNGFQGCILDRNQEQIDAPRFFRCPYSGPEGPDLFSVIDGDAVPFQTFLSGPVRNDAEIQILMVRKAVDEICAHRASAQDRCRFYFHIQRNIQSSVVMTGLLLSPGFSESFYAVLPDRGKISPPESGRSV